MQPHDPSRRRLLGGLFGWLLPRKAQAKAAPSRTQAEPAGGTLISNTRSFSYEAKGQLTRQSATQFTFDGQTRLTTITHF